LKRIIAAILSVVMVLSLLTAQAFAAGKEMKVSVTGVKDLNAIEEGQTITVSVKLPENTSMAGATFELTYDADYFEVTNATSDLIGSDEISKKAGKVVVAYLNTQMKNANFTKNQNMLTVALKATGKVGTSSITLTKQDCGALDGSKLIDYGYTAPAATSVTTVAKQVAVSMITVSPKTLNLEVGQTGTLTATVTPDNATDKTVTWTSSNDKVATVVDGTVAAVGEGTATITATAANGKKDTCKVTVKVPAHKHTPVAVPAQESTCMEKGWEAYYKCSVCDAVVDKDGKAAQIVYLPLAAHKLTETKAVPATCTEDGKEAYWTCSVCKKMFADKDGKKEIKAPVKVAALGHDVVLNKTPVVAGVPGTQMALFSATCKNCDKTVYVANLIMPENTINVIAKQSDNSKKDFSKAVTFGVKASDSKETLKFTIDPVTDDIVKAAKTEAGYKVTETIYKNGAYGWGLADYSETPEAAYAALAEYLKNGITFTQTISAKENTWAADAKSHTMTFDINTADGTFTVKVDGKNESTITFTNTFTYKTVSPGGSGNGGSTTTDTTKNDGKKVESGKTFDAGIAMYVGLSVLSVTGGALVIGKKKERF
jgi:hypothetical protein